MSDIHIRAMEGGDLAGVLGVWNRTMKRDPIDAMRFARFILADPDYRPGPDSGFFVALRGTEPVGFCRAVVRRWPDDRPGAERDDGWIPVLAVDPGCRRAGVGAALLDTALDYFRRHQRKRIWVCGTPLSAPGALTPGIDDDAYPGVRELFARFGFVLDRTVYAMARDLIDFDAEAARAAAWAGGPAVDIDPVTPELVQDLRGYLAEAWPGGWNAAAREKLQRGELHEMLIARRQGPIVGYCQWVGEHFGPFGVSEADRNQQIGAKLFVEALRRIREAGGRYVSMDWADDQSRRFFERFGLSVIRRFSVMRKDMPGA